MPSGCNTMFIKEYLTAYGKTKWGTAGDESMDKYFEAVRRSGNARSHCQCINKKYMSQLMELTKSLQSKGMARSLGSQELESAVYRFQKYVCSDWTKKRDQDLPKNKQPIDDIWM